MTLEIGLGDICELLEVSHVILNKANKAQIFVRLPFSLKNRPIGITPHHDTLTNAPYYEARSINYHEKDRKMIGSLWGKASSNHHFTLYI